MKIRLLVFVGVLISGASNVLGGFETGYGTHHSYAATPVVHGYQGYGGGGGGHQQNAGSYYHYHVPLVSHGHQPSHHGGDNHHYLYLLLLLPLLLLALLPLLLLPLLPLLLIPLGLSLLALLLPLLMMGGMMMMMMMMPGGGMMMMMRSLDESGQMRTLGELLMGDVTSIYSKYARSLDLDHCPERIACEVGSAFFPSNASRTVTAKAFMNYIVDNTIPKGKAKKLIRQYREALWTGSQTKSCSVYKCQPKIKLNESHQTSETEKIFNTQARNSSVEFNYSSPYDYYSPYHYQKPSASNSQLSSKQVVRKGSSNKGIPSSTTPTPIMNSFEIHQLPTDSKENDIDSLHKTDRRGNFFSAFRTPVVRS